MMAPVASYKEEKYADQNWLCTLAEQHPPPHYDAAEKPSLDVEQMLNLHAWAA